MNPFYEEEEVEPRRTRSEFYDESFEEIEDVEDTEKEGIFSYPNGFYEEDDDEPDDEIYFNHKNTIAVLRNVCRILSTSSILSSISMYATHKVFGVVTLCNEYHNNVVGCNLHTMFGISNNKQNGTDKQAYVVTIMSKEKYVELIAEYSNRYYIKFSFTTNASLLELKTNARLLLDVEKVTFTHHNRKLIVLKIPTNAEAHNWIISNVINGNDTVKIQ